VLLSKYRVLKIIFIRVNCSVLEMPKTTLINTSNCLVVSLLILQFGIWKFLYVLGSLGMLSGGRLRNVLRGDRVVGKKTSFNWGTL
jgi:hypothetical protein